MSEDITEIVIGRHGIGLIGLSDAIADVKKLNLDGEEDLKNALLERIKRQNYIPESKVDEYGRALLREYKKNVGIPVEEEPSPAGTSIRILGPGCAACEKMEQDVIAILNELNIAADVQHVRDVNKIAEYGMVRTPTLVINGEVALNGRSLPKSQLKKFLEQKLK